MATLTEETVIDRVELTPETGLVQVRMVTRVRRDGEVIASSYHRTSIEKNADTIEHQPAVVKMLAKALWK